MGEIGLTPGGCWSGKAIYLEIGEDSRSSGEDTMQ